MKRASDAWTTSSELDCPRCRDSLQRPDGDPASAHTMGGGCIAPQRLPTREARPEEQPSGVTSA